MLVEIADKEQYSLKRARQRCAKMSNNQVGEQGLPYICFSNIRGDEPVNFDAKIQSLACQAGCRERSPVGDLPENLGDDFDG
jgi:hypothetical protein